MSISFLPRYLVRSITDLTPELLSGKGIKLLMLDFDNTIVPYTTDVPTEETVACLRALTAAGITLCVVSNSKRQRVQIFCRQYGLPCINHARKPFSKGIRACLAQFQRRPEECALAGDQIFTDVLGANCTGIRSILVKPIHNHNFWLKARHVLEQPFIFLARGRRLAR